MALLQDLTARGVRLTAEGGSLRVRPARLLTASDRAALSAHKPALLALLGSWPQDRADDALAEALAVLDGAEKVLAPPRRHVLEVYREVVRGLYARRDPMLFEVDAALVSLLARWAEADAGKFVRAEDW
jgi:hypothetical protein